ncbi:hypothetical protein BGZ65_008519 [Modicella reniformis]|uniref:Uncharacterized protein n=1 Tax=Modicella reniformis TaxID=1440133 RepID=A0A9P6MAX4_9FUNG|nr:hypothetical protein BGZ65_008519 [Modicella reniformis]
MNATSLKALVTHLPSGLQDLDLDIDIVAMYDGTRLNINTDTTTPMQLQRLDLHRSLIRHKDLLIPLLKRSPLLKHFETSWLGSSIFYWRILSEHCPNLQSFQTDVGPTPYKNSTLTTVCNLLEAYPNGLRSFIFDYPSCYVDDGVNPGDRGALTRSLLKYSTNTIEVLELSGNIGQWISYIAYVLQKCPNLKVLRIKGTSIPLGDLVHESSWKAASSMILKPTTSGSKKPMPSSPPLALPPWVCTTKLEELSLDIDNPACIWVVGRLQRQRHMREPKIDTEVDEFVIRTIRQVGVLWKALKLFKSLKTLSLTWDSTVDLVINTMSFERGTLYLNQIDVTGFTQEEVASMGLDWKSSATREGKGVAPNGAQRGS